MDAAPSSAGIAAPSSAPSSEWPPATQWLPPPAERSIRLSSEPAPVWSRSAQTTMALVLVLTVGLLAGHVYLAGRWGCRPTVLEPGTLDSPSTARKPRQSQRADSPPPPPYTKKPTLTQRLDLNRATAAELRRLPRIGPVLSQRILDARAEKPFRSVDDLRRVRGIGPKTMERLRPYVVVED